MVTTKKATTKKAKKKSERFHSAHTGFYESHARSAKRPTKVVAETPMVDRLKRLARSAKSRPEVTHFANKLREAIERKSKTFNVTEFEAVIDRIEDNDMAVLELGASGQYSVDIPGELLPEAAQGGTRLKITVEVLEV